jgi:hypothetical protein
MDQSFDPAVDNLVDACDGKNAAELLKAWSNRLEGGRAISQRAHLPFLIPRGKRHRIEDSHIILPPACFVRWLASCGAMRIQGSTANIRSTASMTTGERTAAIKPCSASLVSIRAWAG